MTTTTETSPYDLGREAKRAGRPRLVPNAAWVTTGIVGYNDVAAGEAWYRGWDAANLAEPVRSLVPEALSRRLRAMGYHSVSAWAIAHGFDHDEWGAWYPAADGGAADAVDIVAVAWDRVWGDDWTDPPPSGRRVIVPETGPRFSPAFVVPMFAAGWVPEFDAWRHGGWYVPNLRYPSGAVGCVAKVDGGRWAIACPMSYGAELARFSTRGDAAHAERVQVCDEWARVFAGMARLFYGSPAAL